MFYFLSNPDFYIFSCCAAGPWITFTRKLFAPSCWFPPQQIAQVTSFYFHHTSPVDFYPLGPKHFWCPPLGRLICRIDLLFIDLRPLALSPIDFHPSSLLLAVDFHPNKLPEWPPFIFTTQVLLIFTLLVPNTSDVHCPLHITNRLLCG